MCIRDRGESVEKMREKRRRIVTIGDKKIAVLKGDDQRLRIEAGRFDIYLVDERKTPLTGSELPSQGLMRISQAPPGKYTLVVIESGRIARKYIVEVLE